MPWMIVGCLRAAGFIVVAFSLFLIFHLGPRSNVFGMLLLILLMGGKSAASRFEICIWLFCSSGETIYCLVVVFRCYNELGVVRPQISIAVTYQNQPQPPIYGQVYPNYPTPTPFNSQQKWGPHNKFKRSHWYARVYDTLKFRIVCKSFNLNKNIR